MTKIAIKISGENEFLYEIAADVRFVLPPHTVFVDEILPALENKAIIYDFAQEKLVYIDDIRQQKFYNKQTRKEETLASLTVTEHLTNKKPPSDYHTWGDEYWELTVRGAELMLGDKKIAKIDKVHSLRETARYAAIEYASATFQGDKESQDLITSSIALFTVAGGTPPGFVWRDADNVDHAADLAWLAGLGGALASRTAQIFAWSWQLKAQIDEATTFDELDAIVVEIATNE